MNYHHSLSFLFFLFFYLNIQAQVFFDGFEGGPSSGSYYSDYVEITSGNITGGRYAITGNARNVHPSGIGVPNTGNFFMAINGAHTAGEIIWQDTVTVTSNVDYEFSAQVKKIIGGSNALLSFRINGVQLGTNVTAGSWTWDEYSEIWNSGANTSAILSIVYLSASPGGNDFGLDDISFSVNSALPVELHSFNLSQKNNQVTLGWVTASELNNDYFSVERSQNLSEWEVIGQIDGAGTINYEKRYRFVDSSPNNGYTYYRIKQTDFDGRISYSPIKTSNLSLIRNHNGIAIYPVPAKEQITIEGAKDIRILNLLGEDIGSKLDVSSIGENSLKVNITILKPGIYLVQSQDSFYRFVKQ